MLRTVVFDADETLLDLRPAVYAAVVRPDAELSTLTDLPAVLAALVDEEDLRAQSEQPLV